MRAHHSCFGFEGPQTDGLFLGLFPDDAVADRLARRAEQLCIRHRLRAKPLAPERMHVSLLGFGEFSGLPPKLLTAVTEAAATVAVRPFEVIFDRAMSFLGATRPLVLCGGEGVKELTAFQSLLGGAVQRSGLGRVKAQYMPHVTLLYDRRGIEEHAVEPIRWMVNEFALVHSLLGQSKYVFLKRWRLGGQ
jgi:2'-5' RNA ligase